MTTQFETSSCQGGASPTSPDRESPAGNRTAVQEPVVQETLDGYGTPAPGTGSGEPKQPLGRRIWRGHPEDNRWIRPGFLLTLLLVGGLYTWNLTASGYANSFYL
ncbi:hypothetical protein GCM10017771_08440 [Streptomyces capitiformicae]|uniref:Uncharacterized protein n=1 Tax=Streptomyces capitiformicae TaxID=2014920 RepID=A0A919L510_9ACTN|nr:hypothetical protein GCM10017771_08440 [Streptomyces capitiformicae]